jgi:uncharacterized protein (DUF1499 family)
MNILRKMVATIQDFTLNKETEGVLEMQTSYYKNKRNYVTEKTNRKLYRISIISYHIWKH